MFPTRYLIVYIFGGLVLAACQQAPPNSEPESIFAGSLSEMNLFQEPLKDLSPLESVTPYELNTSLFTDYAYKKRFIKLPKGSSLEVVNRELGFPEGTILVKNFYYYEDETHQDSDTRIIETRLLIKKNQEWQVGVYEWDDDQKDATFLQLGNEKEVRWKDEDGEVKTINYVIPDANDCKGCHMKDGQVVPIGPKLTNLNYVFDNGNWQLDEWIQTKYLSGIASHNQIDQFPVWDNQEDFGLDERARAYLDVNCAHCHTAGGPADNTGLYFEYEQADPFKIGIYKGPISAGAGSAHLKYDIVPGQADSSIVYFRMNSTETGIAMPELGRTLNHTEGLELIKDWINTMD